jgi:heterodisulfide reductase subunit B
VEDCILKIVRYAVKNGAEAITTSCPLCNFNLDWSQQVIAEKDKTYKQVPIFYLSEIMALALGVKVPEAVWEEHSVRPRPFLESKGYLNKVIA